MPLIKILSKPSYKIGIWEFSNSEYDSNHCDIIYPNYHKEINQIKNEKRKWQIYGTKMLFNELCKEGVLVSKNKIPHIENLNKNISVFSYLMHMKVKPVLNAALTIFKFYYSRMCEYLIK